MDQASKPDQVEKLLEDWHDVFADIINVLVYHGDHRVRPEDLVDGPTASQYKAAGGRYAEKFRDVCKKEFKEGICYAVLGIENQTEICQIMPLRVLQYDAAAYESLVKDLQAKNKQDGHEAQYAEVLWPGQKIPPVHTVVLYFGLQPWDGPKSLREMLDIPADCAMGISDYPIHIVEVAFLEDEVIEQFTSDFRIVAKFFKAKRLGKEREMMYNDKQEWDHVSEMLEFFHTFTGDKRYGEYKEHLIQEAKKGEFKMCTLLDAFEQEGRQKGFVQGKAEGKAEGIAEGRAAGIAEGRAEGRAEGIAEGKVEGATQARAALIERFAKSKQIGIEVAMEELNILEPERQAYYEWVAAGRP